MRRDYFTVDIQPDTDDGIPAMWIAYDGPSGGLRDRLSSTAETTLESGDIDVAVRRRPDADAGVLGLTDRMTGEFIFEVTAPVGAVEQLVAAAQDGEGQYEVRLTDSDGKSLVYDKRTLLVYDHDGSLLRERSLIPGSVEL